MPRSAAASASYRRWMVLQEVPSPRARAASMKLQMAGAMLPQTGACHAHGIPEAARFWGAGGPRAGRWGAGGAAVGEGGATTTTPQAVGPPADGACWAIAMHS